MNGIVLWAVGVVCFTALLIADMWKADRSEHRVFLRELASQAPPDQLAEIRRQSGLS